MRVWTSFWTTQKMQHAILQKENWWFLLIIICQKSLWSRICVFISLQLVVGYKSQDFCPKINILLGDHSTYQLTKNTSSFDTHRPSPMSASFYFYPSANLDKLWPLTPSYLRCILWMASVLIFGEKSLKTDSQNYSIVLSIVK